MKSHFLKSTALSVAVFSGLVSPMFTSSGRTMNPEELLTQVFVHTIKPKIMWAPRIKQSIMKDTPDIADWNTLNLCRSLSRGSKKGIDQYIVENKLIAFSLTLDNYKDERMTGFAPLITTLCLSELKDDNIEEIGPILSTKTFPFLQKLMYGGAEIKNMTGFCWFLGKGGSISPADPLNQELGLNPCPKLKCLSISLKFDPIICESLNKLTGLQTLELGDVGDLDKFAKKLSSLENITSLKWMGFTDRLGIYKLYNELKDKEKFKKLSHLAILTPGQVSEIQYAEEKFKKLEKVRPNLSFDLSYKY